MKLGRSLKLTIKTASTLFHYRPPSQTTSFLWHSTQTTLDSETNNNINNELFKRISRLGSPKQSMVPVLDQWVNQGHPLTQFQLRRFVRELRHYRRFKHALEISQWMSDKRCMLLSASDVSIRLDLIAKVYGIEQAENYFNNTPKQMKTMEVYGALLNCYAHVKCVDKADAVMQKMKEVGYANSTLAYNVLLSLYYQTENREKGDALIHEMAENQIKFDRCTYTIVMNSHGVGADIDKLEKILKTIESDTEIDIDWKLYASLAYRFIKAGSIDKALELLRKAEKLVVFAYKKNEAYSYLLTLYARAGNKEDVLRVWNDCRMFKVYNKNYICVMPSVLKFNDIESAENIFKEWKASVLSKDFRIPNILVRYYCKNGLVDKAEALIETAKMENWEKPKAWTWYSMSFGYVKSNKIPKAVEAMENALFEHIPRTDWKPDKALIMACLKYLKHEGNEDRSSNFVRLLQEKDMISEEIKQKLLLYFSGKCDYEDRLVQGWSKDRNEVYDAE